LKGKCTDKGVKQEMVLEYNELLERREAMKSKTSSTGGNGLITLAVG